MWGKNMIERMTEVALQTGEPVLKQPLLEVCGEHRVLIEHHKGVEEYSRNAVKVKVRFGSILVEGTGLEICSMTAEQLVIVGDIDTVALLKGRGI